MKNIAVAGGIIIVGLILIALPNILHDPSAEECFQKANQLFSEGVSKSSWESFRNGEDNPKKSLQDGLRRSEKWFRKAIDKGHPNAHETLGNYLHVVGRREEGLNVLLDGANKGYHTAMFAYAIIGFRDNGEITEEEAYEWLHRAEQLGNIDAFDILEIRRKSGRRLPFLVALEMWDPRN